MKVYTGFGDSGKTALFGAGDSVLKNHPRVEVYGTLDELNSIIGIIRSKNNSNIPLNGFLEQIQNLVFVLSSEIATPDESKRKTFEERIEEAHCRELESEIDRLSDELPDLKKFILPGGAELASFSHLARTVCRRAERLLVTLNEHDPQRTELIVFVNRLSDYFFVLARYFNHLEKMEDITWQGIRKKKA